MIRSGKMEALRNGTNLKDEVVGRGKEISPSEFGVDPSLLCFSHPTSREARSVGIDTQ